MSWAYSGSIEKPRAVPQSVVLAATKMGMEVTLAHPKGFDLDPEVITHCENFSQRTKGSFKIVNDFEEGFQGADIVYPKSWGSVPCFNYTDETGKTIKEINRALLKKSIFGGKDLSAEFRAFGNSALYCVTEIHSKEDIDYLVRSLGEIVAD